MLPAIRSGGNPGGWAMPATQHPRAPKSNATIPAKRKFIVRAYTGTETLPLTLLLSSSKITTASQQHMKRPKLAKLELRILDVLWTRGGASMREIQQGFPEPLPAYTTITNTVYRMEAKKVVRRVRKIGNADIFEPLIARDTARDSLLDEILSFFGGRPQPMMAQLIESGKLTLDDIRELEIAAAEAERKRSAERTRKSK
jgi:predicted transcriptional regulator